MRCPKCGGTKFTCKEILVSPVEVDREGRVLSAEDRPYSRGLEGPFTCVRCDAEISRLGVGPRVDGAGRGRRR